MSPHPMPEYREATALEKAFNRVFGFFVGWGLGLPHNYLLQVRGRRSGRVYSMPVNLLELNAKRYLVAPRGRTQWVRNAETAGEITLKKGLRRHKFRLRPIPDTEKGPILQAYLERFTPTVQRYFPVPAKSDVATFREIARNYPVFVLEQA